MGMPLQERLNIPLKMFYRLSKVAISGPAPSHQARVDIQKEGLSENNRRAHYYQLTLKGRRQLDVETRKWNKLAGAIARILRPVNQEGS